MKRDETGICRLLIRTGVGQRATTGTRFRNCRPGAILFLLYVMMITVAPMNAVAQQSLVVDVNVYGVNSNQEVANQQLSSSCSVLANDTSAAAVDLRNTCQLINELDPNDPDDVIQLQRILDTFAPEEAFSVNDSIVYVSDYQTTNVHARINALRAPPPVNTGTNLMEANWQTRAFTDYHLHDTSTEHSSVVNGSGAAADDLTSRLGIFFTAQLSSGDVDGSTFEQDADISSSSFTTVADYRLTDNWVTGLGIGVLQNETSFTNVGGSTDSDGFNVTAFGSWYEESKGYIDIVLDFGQNSHDLERAIGTNPNAPVLAQASTDSSAVSLSIGAGRYIKVSDWDLGGYLRLSLTNGSIDGYKEQASNTNAGSGSLFSFNSQTAESRGLIIGVEASRVVSTSKAVLIPVVRLEYESETEEKKDNLQSALIASQVSASYRGSDRDTSFANLGLGGSVVFKQGRSAYAFYETHLQHDFVTQSWLKFGLRLEF